MNQHTEGPWDAESNGVHRGAQCIAITHARDGVARVADAKLIAAAPELLEALRWYIAHDAKEFQYLDKGIGTSTPDGIQRLKAREAAAKAFGLPPA